MTIPVNIDVVLADFEFTALREAKNYRRALVMAFKKQLYGRVIEIGAGIGQMTQEFSTVSDVDLWQAVEPNSSFCGEFRKSLPGKALIEGTICDIKDDDWNAIVSINVLEHIGEDEAELNMYAKLLAKKKGTLNLFVPARPEIYAPIDKDFGHFRRYTKQGLVAKLERSGFVVENIRYYNILGYFAWWWKFCVLKERGFKISEVRFYDRIVFPVVNFFEWYVCRPPIGQSLLVIARAK